MCKSGKKAIAFFAFIVGVTFFCTTGGANADVALASNDIRVAKAAIKAIEAEKWQKARRFTSQVKDKLTLKLLRWITFSSKKNNATFTQISSYIKANPHWPRQKTLRRRAEEAMTNSTPANDVVSWFADYPAVSTDGKVRLGAALLAIGDNNRARTVLRDVWVNNNFAKRPEKDFYRRYHRILTREDHIERLDRLLWEGRKWPTRRMLWKVNPAYRSLGEARFSLKFHQGNVDNAIARVPDKLKNDPGLIFERLRWRRRKGRDASAIELLANLPTDLPYMEKWWQERALLARRSLLKGNISEAYNIAKDHGLRQGADFAEAEWLAGWIALRFLGDNKIAKKHFVTMFKAVNYPISRARGAYWAARAAEAMNDTKAMALWYQTAAAIPTTYYGQLAAARLNGKQNINLPDEPKIKNAKAIAFNKLELVRTIKVLAALDKRDLMRPFLAQLGEIKKTPDRRSLVASLAYASGRPDLAIKMAKQSSRDGRELIHAGYPELTPPPISASLNASTTLETPLVLAMIRQESAFYTKANSDAGALGLMQLLPRTAKRIAKKIRLPYSLKRLRSEPDYNLRIGQTYLAYLLNEFKGSYVLAIAAYNAGPSRVRKWQRHSGNPGDPAVNAVDWVEMIPFNETRNYVQRVLENLQVYRLLLANTEVAMTLASDLKR